MRRIIPGVLALLWAGAGWAASNLQFAPAPSWVKAIPLPAAGTATQAAVKILLVDHQIVITPRTVQHYVESASLIQTPQGLSAAGTITLVWNPDTDVLTVNKIRILRGQKVIDVLASGQTFTIAKRETNLDYASLDDTLTAILQPADLQVGDTLDVAYTLERTDPVLAGASADEVEVSPQVPISEFHVSAQWPTTYPIKWQATDGLSGIRQTHDGDMSGLTLSMSDLQPILEPKQAPLRFLIDRRIDFSGSGSWADVAKILTPLFERAARLSPNSPLQAEIARIRAATPDPKARAALALALVEDKVRYVFLAMNNGGLVPADADQTWSRRYGDCKGKSVLLLALLHGLGIEARPVVVNTRFGDWLDGHLPMVQLFDHVLVEATIDGQTYWLDGTRLGDRSLDHLHVPYYHWGLPLVAEGAALVRMVPEPLQTPATESVVSMDASAGIARPVPFHVEAVIHDYAAVMMQQRLANLTPAQLDDGLRAFWSRQYDFVTIKSVAATYDAKNEVERMTMDGTAQLDWSGGRYAPFGLGIGYDANFERQPGPHQDAPFVVPYPIYDSNTVTIKLPLGGAGFSISGADVDRTLAGIEYQRRARIDGGVFTAVSSSRSVAPEFPAAEAAADQQALRALAKATLDIDAPAGHTPTAAEIAWGLPATNSTSSNYAHSGYMLSQRKEYGAAIADFNEALVLDSGNVIALADRGLTHYWMGDRAAARRDIDAALVADPQSWIALNGRGLLDLDRGDSRSAITALTAALGANPDDAFVLPYRAHAYWRIGDKDRALADYSAAIRHNPAMLDLYWYRAVLLRQEGKKSEAIRQAQLVVAANPKLPLAYFVAGGIYSFLDESSQARAAFDRGVAVAPVAQTYLMRARYRLWTDLAGKRRDIENALRQDPGSGSALVMLSGVQMAAGQYKEAAASLTGAMSTTHSDYGTFHILIARGIAYEKAGESALAKADLDKALAQAKGADELNTLCWELATSDVSLASALEDCNAAIAKEPSNAAVLDSQGFVLMRLGRYDQAIAAYDAALKNDPVQPDSLYGRGVCELRTGEERRGKADIKAATALSFSVADEFAHYGVSP